MTIDEMKRRLAADSEAWKRWVKNPANATALEKLTAAIRLETTARIAAFLGSKTWGTTKATKVERLLALANVGATYDDAIDSLAAVTEVADGRAAADALLGL